MARPECLPHARQCPRAGVRGAGTRGAGGPSGTGRPPSEQCQQQSEQVAVCEEWSWQGWRCRGPAGGWVQHGTDGGRNWCLRAVGPWRLLDRRPGHQGRCRAILRPAGSRVDPARVGSLPKPPPPTPWGQGLSFLPKALLAPTAPPCPPVWAPSWAPPHHPSSPFHLESLLLDSQHPRPSAPCPSVALLTTCHAVWLRRCPLVFCLELGL